MNEVIEVVKVFSWNKANIDDLFTGDYLSLKPFNHDRLNPEKDIKKVVVGNAVPLDSFCIQGDDGMVKISTIKKYAEMERLMWIHGSILLWMFPVSLLRHFDEIFTLTYLFAGSYPHLNFITSIISLL